MKQQQCFNSIPVQTNSAPFFTYVPKQRTDDKSEGSKSIQRQHIKEIKTMEKPMTKQKPKQYSKIKIKIQVKIKESRGIRLDYDGYKQNSVMDILVTVQLNSVLLQPNYHLRHQQ